MRFPFLIFSIFDKVHVIEFFEESSKIETRAVLKHPGVIEIITSH